MSKLQSPHPHQQPKACFKVKARKPGQKLLATDRSLQLERLSQTQRLVPSKEFESEKKERFEMTASQLTKSNF